MNIEYTLTALFIIFCLSSTIKQGQKNNTQERRSVSFVMFWCLLSMSSDRNIEQERF